MSIDLNALEEPDSVWLFHGTSSAIADAFALDGWAPPDPAQVLHALAAEHGVNPELLFDEHAEQGTFRHASSQAHCTSGWRMAASYARMGPEYLYFARGALEMQCVSSELWAEPPSSENEVSVLLLKIPWSDLQELRIGDLPPRKSFLPDTSRRRNLTLDEILPRSPQEVILPGRHLREYLVAIDRIRAECICTPTSVLGRANVDDSRIRCDRCFLSEQLLSE